MIGPRQVGGFLLGRARKSLAGRGGGGAPRPERPSGDGREDPAMRDLWGLFMSTWRKRRLTLVAPLSLEGTSTILRRAVDGPVSPFGRLPAYGMVSRQQARLVRRRFLRNAWATVLVCRFEAAGLGTRIDCTSSAGLFARLFTAVWMVFTAVGFGVYFWTGKQNVAIGVDRLWVLGAAVLMTAFGFGMAILGRWFARTDHDFLVTHVARTLGARKS